MAEQPPSGFLGVPAGGRGRAVLLLHAWWGLNGTIRELCLRLSKEGFVAFAPDLYGGRVANTVEAAEALASEVDRRHLETKARIARAADYLAGVAGPSEPDIAVIGFSLGAFYALHLCGADPGRIRRVVVFYGTGGGDFVASRASFLGHFAESDPYEPDAGVSELEAKLREAGRPVTFHRYPGTGHWFFEPDRAEAYRGGAANLAWERTLAFLRSPPSR